LYCEQEGTTTELIPYGHWGICPVHSKSLADSIRAVSEPDALLKNRGVPGWPAKG
jgi:hypothetical protein